MASPDIRLWGRLTSINVKKVAWCLAEIGLAHERVEAGGAFGVVTTPDYLAMNPNALVPTLEIDGLVLWESNAIVRYLSARHPDSGLWPADPATRAEADRWMDWQATTATPALRDAFWQLIRTPAVSRDQAAVDRSVAASADAARILERHLADRPYVAGDAFSMGDIPLGCHTHRWLNLPLERPALPHLEAWCRRIEERPATRDVLTLPIT